MDIWRDKDSIEVIKKRSTKHFEAVLIYHVPLSFPSLSSPPLPFSSLPYTSPFYPSLPFATLSFPFLHFRCLSYLIAQEASDQITQSLPSRTIFVKEDLLDVQ